MPLYQYPDDTDLKKQSAVFPSGKEGESQSALWDRSVLTAPGQPRTLYELFEQTVAKYPERDCFRYRSVITPPTLTSPAVLSKTLTGITYSTVQRRRNAVGSALLALERSGRLTSPRLPASTVSPVEITFPNLPHYGSSNRVKAGARRGWGVGLWSKNRPEWQLVDMATHAYGLIGVSLYETLGPDVAAYITNHCPLSIIFAEPSKIPALLKMAPRCPALRVVVSLDPIPPAELAVLTQWASSVDVELLVFSEFEAWGATEEIHVSAGPLRWEEDLDTNRIATISYTSGTTGDPKGVVLTNANVTTACISNAHGSNAEVTDIEGTQEWRYISILPLSHIYARFLELVTVYGYGTICYTSGDPLKLVEDAQIIKPNLVAAVPRIFNKIYAAIMTQMSAGGLKGALLSRAYNAKLHNLKETGQVHHRLWDALVFRKIRALLGGEVKYMSSGAAPLSAEVHDLIRVCFSCDVVQGCGMTETIGTMSKGIPWDIQASGTCGQIQPCNDVKLVDVPEMGYTHKDQPNPRGEICVKGSNVTPGYLHDLVNTAKSIDKDGWLHSGDIGEIDQVGRLKIIDRMKNVVKLSQGEYVALEKVEGIYTLNPLFASMMVYADPAQSYIVALAVLDPPLAIELVSKVLGKSLSVSQIGELETAVKDRRVKKAVLQGFKKAAAQHGLAGFETIKGVYLTLQPFPDNLITPTLKLKRNHTAKHFKAQIDEMYAAGATEADGSMLAKL